MSVRFSTEQEKDELEARKKARDDFSWEHYRTGSLVDAVHRAKSMGWFFKKVQVREEVVAEDSVEYVIEPYENGCSCRGLLKYADFFEPPVYTNQLEIRSTNVVE